MVNSTKAIMSIVPTAMAAGLAKHNLKYLKKKKKKSIASLGFDNIAGASFISATARAGDW